MPKLGAPSRSFSTSLQTLQTRDEKESDKNSLKYPSGHEALPAFRHRDTEVPKCPPPCILVYQSSIGSRYVKPRIRRVNEPGRPRVVI